MQVIVKNYAHFNKSMPNWNTPKGVWVKSKAHYEYLCKKNNLIPFEQAEEIAENARKSKIKQYKLSEKAKAIINSAKQSKDFKGNVKLGDRAIDAMIEIKAIGRKIPSYMQLPEAYKKG